MVKFEKVMTRDAPLIMIQAWYRTFTQSIPKVFNFEIKFPEPIYIFNEGAVESWRATDLFFGKLPQEMSKWTKSKTNEKRFLDELRRYIRCGKKLKAKRIKPLVNLSSKRAVNEIKKISNLFIAGGAGLIPSYWCVIWNEESLKNNKEPLFSNEIIKKSIQIREQDTLFDDATDLIYEYLYMIAQNEHWPRELMKFFLLEELDSAVLSNQEPDFKEIQKRKNGYAYFDDKLFLSKDLPKILKQHGYELKPEEVVEVMELAGTSVSPGIVIGRVAIVVNREQIKKVSRGDILVAPMTTPSYLPAMKKAAAFVTDEGGVTCHAAIVSRELKIPCIIGTKIATKVLKDGDLVEVNANHAVIKILK